MIRDVENREILLTSEAFVKAVSNLSDNVAGKYLMPSIREAQEIKLKGILGHALLEKCKTLVKYNQFRASFNLDFNNDFEWSFGGNENYRALIDECQYFLAYSAIVEVIYKTSFKLANMGLVKSTDQNMQPPTKAEIDNQRAYYQSKADAEALRLQGYLLENRTKYPELTENDCNRIQSNLYSAASCGLFLGGARGKALPAWRFGYKKYQG